MWQFNVQNPPRPEHRLVIPFRQRKRFTRNVPHKSRQAAKHFWATLLQSNMCSQPLDKIQRLLTWLHLTVGPEDCALEKRNSELCTQKLSKLYQYFDPPRFLSLYSTLLISYRLDCPLSRYYTSSCPFAALWKFTSCLKTNSPAHCMKLHFKRAGSLFHIVWSLHSGLFAPLLHGD